MTFKLPITYRKTYAVPPTMAKDLELTDTVDSNGTSMYDCLLKPKTEFAKSTARKWAEVFTDDTAFLKETVELVRETSFDEFVPDDFMSSWKRVQDTVDFATVFQYIEQKQLAFLNMSPKFLCALSCYSMSSPVLFILSPLVMLLIPFVLLKARNMPVTWSMYRTMLKDVLSKHAVGGLLIGFKGANANQRMYLLVTAIFFGIQMYSNVQTCVTFFKNIKYVHLTLSRVRAYLEHALKVVDTFNACAKETMGAFLVDMNAAAAVLREYHAHFSNIRPGSISWGELMQMGKVRQLFYRLREAKLKAAFEYSFGLLGFAENLTSLKMMLSTKKINACSFGTTTKFSKAVYPVSKQTPNSYTVANCAITGPNASGKTTFIKMTMLNVLFSQQMGVGYYKNATISPYRSLCCYLNIPDTSGRDSLFQAEARRCKEILDSIGDDRMLCIFDELFSGTNPTEASASAYAFLMFLETKPQCTFLLTTHFLDVCAKIENSTIKNMHMKTRGMGDEMKYLYKFDKGISHVKGGVRVLQELGFPTSIVACARACG